MMISSVLAEATEEASVIRQMLTHTDWGLTLATIGLTWATCHLWSDREKEKVRKRFHPWKKLHTTDTQYHNGDHVTETDYEEGDTSDER